MGLICIVLELNGIILPSTPEQLCTVNKHKKSTIFFITGDHYGATKLTRENENSFWKEVAREWAELIEDHNAEGIANKYTEDCTYIHHEKGLIHGRDSEFS